MKTPFPFYVGGTWKTSPEHMPVVNPYNGRVVTEICRPGAEDVQDAVEAAARAFSHTRSAPSWKRALWLRKAADQIESTKEELARVLCLEAGKPLRYARAEIGRAVCTLKVASEEAGRLGGEVLPLDWTEAAEGRLGLVRRFPLGPVAGISPFNFPMNLVCHKAAPALAAGNSMVLKPASATPLSALRLAQILEEADIPAGAFNVIPCKASLAEALVTDERFKMISFTGSADVGWGIKQKAGKKRVCLELGGNAAVIIEPDADMETAVRRCVMGGFAYSGQVCISVQRIYVDQSVYETFAHDFGNRVKTLKIGDPLSEETDIGPMIDEASAVQTIEWIGEAVNQGGRILCGGRRDGRIVEPTVLENVSRNAKVSCREVFAPVVVMAPYETFEQALDWANDSVYGLQAGVFTRDLEKAFQAYNELEVGGVVVNDVPTFRVDHMPYGGVKDSGFGREGVRYAMEEMSEIKLMAIRGGLGQTGRSL